MKTDKNTTKNTRTTIPICTSTKYCIYIRGTNETRKTPSHNSTHERGLLTIPCSIFHIPLGWRAFPFMMWRCINCWWRKWRRFFHSHWRCHRIRVSTGPLRWFLFSVLLLRLSRIRISGGRFCSWWCLFSTTTEALAHDIWVAIAIQDTIWFLLEAYGRELGTM